MANRQKLNEWWKAVAPQMAKALGLGPLAREQADAFMAGAEECPISDTEIDRMVAAATRSKDDAQT